MDSIVWWPAVCGNRSRADAFWDEQETVNTSSPDFTRCFENTVLLWVPCGYLWILLPAYLCYLQTRLPLPRVPTKSSINLAKLIVCALSIIVGGVDLAKSITEKQRAANYITDPVTDTFLASGVLLATLILALVLMHIEFRKRMQSSGVLLIFWFFLLLVSIVRIRTIIMDYNDKKVDGEPVIFHLTTRSIHLALIVIQLILQLLNDRVAAGYHKTQAGEYTPLLSSEEPNPRTWTKPYEDLSMEEKSTFLSNITYFWFIRLLINGYKKPVEVPDLFRMREEDFSHSVIAKFNRAWDKLKEKYMIQSATRNASSKEGKPPLLMALVKSCGMPIFLGTFARMLNIAMEFANPMLLRLLIAFVQSNDPYEWKGYMLAMLLLINNIVKSILLQFHYKLNTFTGQRFRMAVTTALYRKILRLSPAARRHISVGEIVNTMSVDAQKLQDCCFFFSTTWSIPVILGFGCFFLWQTVGPSCMAGVTLLIFMVPLNAIFLGARIGKLQRSQMRKKDTRIKLLSEMMTGIKVLKFYAWEEKFQEKVMDCRIEELHYIKWANCLSAISASVLGFLPTCATLVIFIFYLMTDSTHVLDADKAFVTQTLLNILAAPTQMLPVFVMFVGQALVAVRRIGKILVAEEIDPTAVERDPYMEDALAVQGGNFSWGPEDPTILQDINLAVSEGSLVAVVGQVGSGKSSLCSSFLGELTKQSGTVKVKSALAYVPQQAWIQNATVKENILFGKKFKTSYDQVLEACALKPDLAILPGGDATEIGEKGINLSGGQKQRVSLARAVYQNRDIYLLDDPLSAVDAHVGKHIFEHVIGNKGLLRNKTRVLVTHAITYLSQVDKIVVLVDGQVSEVGTYQELLDENGAFAEFIRTYQNENNGQSSDEGTTTEGKAVSVVTSGTDGEPGIKSDDTSTSSARKRRTRKSQSKSEHIEEPPTEKQTKQIVDEISAVGSIKPAVIKKFIASGGWGMFSLVILGLVVFVVVQVLLNLWLSSWSNDAAMYSFAEARNRTSGRLAVYGALAAVALMTYVYQAMLCTIGCIIACRVLHTDLLKRLLRAPMSFFDTTPLGRILNRFAKDMDTVDTNIPQWTRLWLFMTAPLFATIVIISNSTPLFLVILVPVGIIYIFIQKLYIATVRQLKRIDSVARSPIYAHFDETLVGVGSIRAYNDEARFIARSDELVDISQTCWYNIIIAQRWIGVTLDSMGAFIVFFASLFAVINRANLSGGVIGVSISYALQVTGILNMQVRSATELETYIVSVERILEYCDAPQEAPWVVPGNRPRLSWPENGAVTLTDYSTRYRPDTDLVLRNLDLNIASAQKVGIVGRTGAGKSSVTLALFRIIEAAGGSISIDNINISMIGLHDLRSKISIIPQDPVLFSGTLRMNLDPFNKFSEDEIWRTLQLAHLKTFVESLSAGIDYDVGEGGEALSVGQRQLVCLARALLRRSKILVLDEATAAVDLETDDLIQTTIRTEFTNSTVITIAHRLNTVLDYDMVLVLDQGQIVEYDAPTRLMQNKDGVFYSMAKNAGLV